MTIVEYRLAHTIDDEAAVQASAFLVVDPAAPDRDAAPVAMISPNGVPLIPFADGIPAHPISECEGPHCSRNRMP